MSFTPELPVGTSGSNVDISALPNSSFSFLLLCVLFSFNRALYIKENYKCVITSTDKLSSFLSHPTSPWDWRWSPICNQSPLNHQFFQFHPILTVVWLSHQAANFAYTHKAAVAPLFGSVTKDEYSNLPEAVSLQQAQCTYVRHVARHERTIEVCFVKCWAVDSGEERLLSLNVKVSAGLQPIRAHWTLAVHRVGDPHSRGVGGIVFPGPSDFMPPQF